VVSGVELLTDRVRVAIEGRPSALVDGTPAAVADLGLAAGQQVWLSAKATEVVAYPQDPGSTSTIPGRV
jgi:molybdate transport system ATP-binding protein